jgi:hypothetical protein
MNVEALALCLPVCDPLAQDCDDEYGCYWVTDAFHCVSVWSESGPGTPCAYINDCAPGNTCLAQDQVPECGSESCCASFCDLSDPSCPALTECIPWFGDRTAPEGQEDVGACVLP